MMMNHNKLSFLLLAASTASVLAFAPPQQQHQTVSTTALSMDRRGFWNHLLVGTTTLPAAAAFLAAPANAVVYMDPAQYGDQELRVGAVDSVREACRRAILKNPKIAPSFYELALLDGLSFNAKTQEYGPDGSILKLLFTTNDKSEYVQNMQEAALALIDAEKNLRKKTAISLPDAIAIAGAESIESIGGPVLTVQLGRADTPKNGKVSPDVPLDLFSGKYTAEQVAQVFRNAGLTEREMTALLAGLMTLQIVEKSRSVDDWRESTRPKFREPGKMGRMSDFKKLTDEDFAQAEREMDPDYEDPDDGWYIADSFGTRDQRFGDRIGKDQIDEKNFNKYMKEINDAIKGKKTASIQKYGWIAELLVDPSVPTAQTWVQKYAGSNLNFVKDLSIAFNSVTQLGAVYTGGKYENLLKNKPRKSLNDDDLKLF